MKFYECVFAPCAATWRDAIRVAQLVRDEGQSAYEAFGPEAFRGWGQTDIPVVVDHDATRRAGTVTAVSPHGDWWRASFVLDGPHAARAADLIERCGNVSPSFHPVEKDPHLAKPISSGHHATHWYLKAKLDELSIVTPNATAWYQGAKVTRSYEPRTSTAPITHNLSVRETEPVARRHTAQPDGGEVVPGNGQRIIRHGIGQVLRVH